MVEWKKHNLPTRAEKEAAEKKQQEEAEARRKLPERVDALETANDDIILMMADLIGG